MCSCGADAPSFIQSQNKSPMIFSKNHLAQVKKRDGRIVPFDENRIMTAIAKAMSVTSEGSRDDAQKVTEASRRRTQQTISRGTYSHDRRDPGRRGDRAHRHGFRENRESVHSLSQRPHPDPRTQTGNSGARAANSSKRAKNISRTRSPSSSTIAPIRDGSKKRAGARHGSKPLTVISLS